jgi:prepilin-type processing-associated H-X9-DG protein
VLQCPSDGRNALTSVEPLTGLPFARSNYEGSSGTIPLDYDPSACDGVFCKIDGADPFYGIGPPVGFVVKIAMITDGTSNTAAWSERVKGIGYKSTDNNGAQFPDPQVPSTMLWYIPSLTKGGTQADVPIVYTNCKNSQTLYTSQSGSSERVVGDFWWCGQFYTGRYNHTMPPNSKLCTAGNDNYDAEAYGPLSLHPGGVNVGFADGSVRFVKSTISPQTWWALGTRAGGEVVSSDQY